MATSLNDFSQELWEQQSIHKIISRAMARPDVQTFKFNGQMVRESKPLWDWAEYVVDHYEGTWPLMVEFRMKQRTGTQLSETQLAVALNFLLSSWKRSLKEVKPAERKYPDEFDAQVDLSKIPNVNGVGVRTFNEDGTPAYDEVVVQPKAEPKQTFVFKQKVQRPHDGTYTYTDQNGDYRVIKFRSVKDTGVTYVSYQYGPSNTADFAKCGKIDADGMLIVWGAAFPRGDAPCIDHTPAQRADLLGAIVFICSFDKDAQLKAGEAYAQQSGVCFMCGRDLTVPSSISAGLGPVCAEKWGV